jgi:hypothetical protein
MKCPPLASGDWAGAPAVHPGHEIGGTSTPWQIFPQKVLQNFLKFFKNSQFTAKFHR